MSHSNGPMPPDRFQELLARREQELRGVQARVFPPDRQLPPPVSTPFARELLAQFAGRPAASGELLVLFEEASLADLQNAAGPLARRLARPTIQAAGDLPLPASLTQVVAPEVWLLSDRARQLLGREPGTTAWLKAAHDLTRGGVKLSLVMVIGHLEVWPERVELLTHVAELHARTGGVLELGIRACRGPQELPADLPAALRDSVPWPQSVLDADLARTAAIARLGLPAEIDVFLIA